MLIKTMPSPLINGIGTEEMFRAVVAWAAGAKGKGGVFFIPGHLN